MSTQHLDDQPLDDQTAYEEVHDAHRPAPDVTVRRNAALALGVLVVSLALGVAYLVRALGGGGIAAWVLALALLTLGIGQLLTLRDARAPLLVADDFGVRIRLGRTWKGLPWSQMRHVVVEPRTSLLHDGRLLIEPADPATALDGLDARARRGLRLSQQVYGGPLVVPLGITTMVSSRALVDDLVDLADGRARVVEMAGQVSGEMLREGHRDDDEGPRDFDGPDDLDGPDGPGGGGLPVQAEQAPDAERDGSALRDRVSTGLTASFGSVRQHLVAATRIPTQRRGSPEEEQVLEGFEPEVPALIGPRLRHARERVGLSVPEVSARTRIRAHVIEAAEEEDFAPCGGDFYARGHLRTLAAVLGMDGEALVADFDAAYAHEPVSASTVLSAGSNRAVSDLGARLREVLQGPRWSVVAAVALCLVLAWSVARLATGGDASQEATPSRQESGQSAQLASGASKVTIVVRTPEQASRVVVRDASGDVVFRGRVTPGNPRTVSGSGPLTVRADEPGAVRAGERAADGTRIGTERTVRGAGLSLG